MDARWSRIQCLFEDHCQRDTSCPFTLDYRRSITGRGTCRQEKLWTVVVVLLHKGMQLQYQRRTEHCVRLVRISSDYAAAAAVVVNAVRTKAYNNAHRVSASDFPRKSTALTVEVVRPTKNYGYFPVTLPQTLNFYVVFCFCFYVVLPSATATSRQRR